MIGLRLRRVTDLRNWFRQNMLLQEIQLMARIAVSIAMEAAPFLLLGSVLSAVIEKYVDPVRLSNWVPKHPAARIAAGVFAGLALPICECGSVPLARRLLDKGMPPQTAIVYMLSAPVINPVVLVSTFMAFGGSLRMVFFRALFIGVSAAVIGWIIGGRISRAGTGQEALLVSSSSNAHRHPHGNPAAAAHVESRFTMLDLLSRNASEFLDMGKYLILGAVAASAVKVFLPWQLVQTFANNTPLAIGLLMVLAILLCVCSEADAFVAASFVFFPPAAQMAFMTIGPMVDLKLIGMYFLVFRKKMALILIVAPVVSVFIISNLLALLMR